MRLVPPTVAFMQRTNGRFTSGYAARRAALRDRKQVSPQPSRPAATHAPNLYSLRMRNPSELRATWAAYVRQLREATGISRPELARRLSVDPATVWRWETQKQKPESPDIPQAIARLFALDVDEVLGAAGLTPETTGPVEAPRPPVIDKEIELVRTDPDLDPETKMRLVDRIIERRTRERAASLAETRELIQLMKRRQAS